MRKLRTRIFWRGRTSLQWRHSGFSVHNRVRVKARDDAGRRRLARYMIRNPFALAKMTYDPKTAMVIYRSQMHATLKRNYQLMPALKWLRLLLNHIPDKYEHLVRYYGYYSNRSRGARRQAEPQSEEHAQITIDDRPPNRRCKANWARLIQKVYEVDPLECPHCGATMRIIALSAVSDDHVWLDVGAHGRTKKIFDACLKIHPATTPHSTVKAISPYHRRQLCPITDNLNRLRVKLIRPAG